MLIKFLGLEGGHKFEAGCLLNFHYFHKVVSLFCNKTIRTNVPKDNYLNMTLQLKL